MGNSKLPSVLLYIQAKITDWATIQIKKGAKGRRVWGKPTMKNSGRCHKAHITPTIRAETNAPR
jgi:hypothetical protein